jgi:DHA3 family tetracycline resistance protein-like MFS transporter
MIDPHRNTIVTQAWIVDEIGEQRAGEAFLRGSQAGQAGGLIAIPISVALGSVTARLPILLGGGLMILLAAFLALAMMEEGFTPTPPKDRTAWAMMLRTVQDARQMVHRQPLLLALLGIGLFYGLHSEGFDRQPVCVTLPDPQAFSAWAEAPSRAYLRWSRQTFP